MKTDLRNDWRVDWIHGFANGAFLCLFFWAMIGCKPQLPIVEVDKATAAYRIILIDHCEYLEVYDKTYTGSLLGLTHKGNCTNKIHNIHL